MKVGAMYARLRFEVSALKLIKIPARAYRIIMQHYNVYGNAIENDGSTEGF